MRKLLIAVALLVAAAGPLSAQAKRQRDIIGAKELKEYATSNLREVIERARPHFLQPDINNAGRGFTVVHNPYQILVYIAEQRRGDASLLGLINVREVEEVRYYRPGDANVRFGVDNAAVIQLKLKELHTP